MTNDQQHVQPEQASELNCAGLRVVVAGIGVSGVEAARVLTQRGARVTVLDAGDGPQQRERGAELEAAGADVRLGAAAGLEAGHLPDGTELVVTSPGWPPYTPLFASAHAAGVPIWGDVELAWRLRGPNAAPWLAVTGTNGKTSTVRMLAAILAADGLSTAAIGNVGTSVLRAVLGTGPDDQPYDVLAVELSSFQLHWAPSLRAHSAAVLNLAPDHLDWHESAAAYAADKARVYEGCEVACVYNTADPATEAMVRDADVTEGARAIGFTLGAPAPSQLGVVDDLLVDRAFCADRYTNAQELAAVTDVQPPVPHNVANALAAAALARAYGVSADAVRCGLTSFRPDAHRITQVGSRDGVSFVDDSKATNTHAAAASLTAFDHAVWIAGGDAKGADFTELVSAAAARLRAAVLLGRDRELIAAELRRHAPDVPIVEVSETDTGAMAVAVREAHRLAQPGDTVLLAPACASWDMYANYGQRGEMFAAAVEELGAA